MTMLSPRGIPILMYHEVCDQHADESLLKKLRSTYIVTKKQFAEQMEAIKQLGFKPIGTNDLLNQMSNSSKPRDKHIVITFDDGFAGNFDHALPILSDFGFPAIFFVTTAFVGKQNMLTWDQIEQMQRAGMSIDSHGVNHYLLSKLSNAEMATELEVSKKIIEQRLGSQVRLVAFPGGSFDGLVTQEVVRARYDGACTSIYGFNPYGSNLYKLRRIMAGSELTATAFKRLIAGEPAVHLKLVIRRSLLASARGVLGDNLYSKLYNRIFGLAKYNGQGL